MQFSRSVDVGADIAVVKDKNISEPLQYLSTGTDTKVDRETVKDTTLQLSTIGDVKDGGASKNVSTPETLPRSANEGVNDQESEKGIITSKPVQSSTDGVKDEEVAKDITSLVSLYSSSGGDVKYTHIAKDTIGTTQLQSSTGDGMKDVVINDTPAPEPIGTIIVYLNELSLSSKIFLVHCVSQISK